MADTRGLDPRFAPFLRLSSVKFLTYTGEEIKRISCKKVTNPNTFDSLLHPNDGGLYDPTLGPCDKQDLCGTCGLNYVHCPGHMGHIPLPLPVYHPIFFMPMYQLARGSCWNCQRLLSPPLCIKVFIAQLELVENGLISDALSLESKKFVDKADVSDAIESVENLVTVLAEFLQKCKNVAMEDDAVTTWKTKNIVEYKQKLILNFLKICSKTTKKCTYCAAPARIVRQENRTRLFLKPLARKNATAWVEARKKEFEKKINLLKKMNKHISEGEGDDSPAGRAVKERSKMLEALATAATSEQCTKQSYISPLEMREHIRGLWENQPILMGALFGGNLNNPNSLGDVFLLDVIPVPPSRFRPISKMGEKRFENPQTTNLHRILMGCIFVHELMAEHNVTEDQQEQKSKQSFSERLQSAWVKLQFDVNCFMDSSCDRKGTAPAGIKQILEKKEGLFRKHMMGKRVDYAARSVISPDPYINMDEIGVPMVFATRLTYPQPVTHWNVKELRQAVINGPHQHPGATHVVNEDGSVVLLNSSNQRQRMAIAKKLLTPSKGMSMCGATKKVFRHLKDGDVLLVNRQPTLHKPSIMAHKARVLPGEKTLRLHYANCKSYNADFDGDEMNTHFPQNELARAEAYNIVSTHEQYLVPKDGTPLSGLIQDHVVSGVLMTLRGRFFNRSDYMQLVFSALPRFCGYFKTLPPCVWKPDMLWSGKQVVSTVLLNIIPAHQDKLNLSSRTKIAPKEWGRCVVRVENVPGAPKKNPERIYQDDKMTESEVVFCEGELMCGVLDKSQFGASQFGFVHSCHELYGGLVSNLLLSALGRLFTTFLQQRGFTLGVEDILLTDQADQERHNLIAKGRHSGTKAAAEAFSMDESVHKELFSQKYEALHRSKDQTGVKTLDYFIKKQTDHYNNSINTVCVPAGLQKPFPNNCLQLMVQAGAKGSTVNCMQISCLLGQIELEGQRPPLMPSGRFLPSFLPYDTSPRAGGFVDGRFLTGIRPQEYFFHCMAGREGLVDTAVKTSRSGYLQRCLIKHLEGICVGYDLTVRDSDGSVIQFLYGEDGLDINKTRFLRPEQFPFLVENYGALRYKLDPESAMSCIDIRRVPKYQKKLDRWFRKCAPLRGSTKPYKSAFLNFQEKHIPEITSMQPDKTRKAKYYFRTKAERQLLKSWRNLSEMAKDSVKKQYASCPVPVNAHLRPDTHFGSIPEKLSAEMDLFIEQNHRNILGSPGCAPPSLSPEKFEGLVLFKCLRALVDPGEAVGLLAAQSIGEPSTQMTLNTFHFAGRGEMNVTLGIPRLREILMTASANIKTPAMDVPLLPMEEARKKGEDLKKLFTRVHLSDVLEEVEVWESMARKGKGHLFRCYKVKLSFLPSQYYKEEFVVSPQSILNYVEVSFIKKFVAAINKVVKLVKQKRLKAVTMENEGGEETTQKDDGETEQAVTPPDEDEDEDLSDMEEGEGDATASKQLAKKQQQSTYEDPGDSDVEVMVTDNDGDFSDEEETPISVVGGSKENEESDMEESVVDKKAFMDKDRIQQVLESNRYVVDYEYDSVDELWCQFTLKFPLLNSKVMLTSVMDKLAPKSVVWETSMINRGYLSESTEPGETGLWRLKTDGVNLQVLWSYPEVLDLSRAYTNNIHAMANTYGIEAACKSIIKEISGVFRVYGIAVDPRHLSLIADYMTFEGSYKPFNRIGIQGNSSPFQKMSFETTMNFLKNATITGESDSIKSPSACLVTGRVVHGGTGSFELLQSLI